MPNVAGRAVAPRERDSVVVSVRMPQGVFDRLKRLAEDDERSTAWMARRLIERGLDESEQARDRRRAGHDAT